MVFFDLSRSVARSGTRRTYQKSIDVVAYVETAKTSQMRGLLNCGQVPIELGYGMSQKKSQGRPRWRMGYWAAQATAKIVIASAKRLIDVRHCWRRRSKTAEISVAAWPMPAHHTKLTMSQPQATGSLMPQMPMPLRKSQPTETKNRLRRAKATPNAGDH